MYQVITQPRPGRPGVALIATALLLLLTVGFAWLVVEHKTHGQFVPLADPKVYPAGELRCRLPSGWKENSRTGNESARGELPPGVILAASEPVSDHRLGRQLFVIRGLPHPYGSPAADAVSLLSDFLSRVGSNLDHLELGDSARLGPLPAWTLRALGESPLGGGASFLARAGVAPRGETVGLVLVVPDALRAADRQLLDQLSASVELLSVKPTDPQEVMKAAGIQFSPPEGATFFAETLGRTPRVQMCGGKGDGVWYAMAYRVALFGSRTPQALLTDFARSELEPAESAPQIEKKTVLGREVASLVLVGKEASILAAAARIDAETALLVIGRCEKESQSLSKRIQDICGTAKVEPYSTFVDPEKARQAARDWLQQFASKGLSLAWGSYEKRLQSYTMRAPGLTTGQASRAMQQSGRQGWWEVLTREKYSFGVELTENWRIRNDAGAHALVSHLVRGRSTIKYTEDRSPDVREIHRELVSAEHEPETYNTPIDDIYACDLVMEAAAGQIALQRDAKPAMFSTTDAFTRGLPNYTIVPLGQLPLPGNPERKAAAVQIQSDYDPQPIFLYFDDSQTLLAAAYDSGSWRTLTRNSAQGGDAE